jgi:glycerol-3-phosphate acyltransferase PlsY
LKGGKGIATALGVFLVLAPWAGIASFTLFVILVFATRLVSLASVIAAVMIPVFAMLTVADRSPYFIFAIIFIALLCILKHKANIARLMNRTEPKFGTKKETAA